MNVIYGQIATSSSNPTITIPTTISKESQNAVKNITSQISVFVTPEPNDLNGCDVLNAQVSAMSITQSQSLVDSFEASITSAKFGNVPYSISSLRIELTMLKHWSTYMVADILFWVQILLWSIPCLWQMLLASESYL